MHTELLDDQVRLYQGNCLEILQELPEKSVHCCVTSPPYWGLRDYGLPKSAWGGDPKCEHEWGEATYVRNNDQTAGQKQRTNKGAIGRDEPVKNGFCSKCGAWLGCLGLEPTPDLYVKHLVDVFRGVWRVLRDDGTLWLNLGDSYAGAGDRPQTGNMKGNEHGQQKKYKTPDKEIGLKPKDLVGIPWMVAFALRADGWYLRSDIIWAKPNPMPESVTDRPTKAHEYIFLLTKSARYYWDAEAVKELATTPPALRDKHGEGYQADYVKGDRFSPGQRLYGEDGKRNIRSVWTINTHPYSGAHFAVMPEAIVEPCIKAGTSEGGCCPICGKTWERLVEKTGQTKRQVMNKRGTSAYIEANGNALNYAGGHDIPERQVTTLGWRPTCDCPPAIAILESIPCTVLDPFGGSGTVASVAVRLGRRAILCDLNPNYIEMQKERVGKAEQEVIESKRQMALF